MYEYKEESNPLCLAVLPDNIEIQKDLLPVKHPYVPRLCEHRGYFLIWYGNVQTDEDLVEDCLRAKNEEQWVHSNDYNKIDKAVALVYPYEDEVIIGTVKYAGYVKNRSKSERTKLLKNVWNDLILMFGDRKIICPSGTYFDHLHLCINQKRAPHEAYHKRLMIRNGFIKHGEFWIRNASLLAQPTSIY